MPILGLIDGVDVVEFSFAKLGMKNLLDWHMFEKLTIPSSSTDSWKVLRADSD